MEIEIILQNSYYSWEYDNNNEYSIWWKGPVYFHNEFIQISDLERKFPLFQKYSPCDITTTKKILYQLNGSFSFIIENADYVLCVVDRIRSIPLFYSLQDNHLILSDDAYLLRKLVNASFNENHGAEFLVTGYVTGPDTLFNGIYQLQAGEFLLFNKTTGNYSIERYFHYLHGNYSTDSEEQLISLLDTVMLNVFKRLIMSTSDQGKTIVVPLSGGLDSRLIVAMLKRLGVKNVICFSYGKKGNKEAEISKKVAESLGYPWYFVEYTNKRWFDSYHSDQMRKYEQYAGNLTSLQHIQDYIAVKILKEERKIPDHAVFVPGHSGDMLAGSWIPFEIKNMPFTIDSCINHLLQRHYSLWRWNNNKNETIDSLFRERIRKAIGNIAIDNAESFANTIEYFNFNERQAKFIVNSVRVYEFFGYEWRIPLWDAELIDFFLQVPLPMRFNQFLYKKYIFDKIFKREFEELSKITCTTVIKDRLKSSKVNTIKNIIFKRFPLIRDLLLNVFRYYKIITEYSSHPMNCYSIMSKKEFKKFYSGLENINSFLTKEYIMTNYADLSYLNRFF